MARRLVSIEENETKEILSRQLTINVSSHSLVRDLFWGTIVFDSFDELIRVLKCVVEEFNARNPDILVKLIHKNKEATFRFEFILCRGINQPEPE